MAAFEGYHKIPSSSSSWKLSPADMRRLDRLEWAATEKVHGANLCFTVSQKGIGAASRHRQLSEKDGFFGWKAVRELLSDSLRAAAPRILAGRDGRSDETVLIFGEIFGGNYPHPDVQSVPGMVPVQTGVWYHPEVCFVAFDAAVDGPGGREFVDFAASRRAFLDSGIPCVPLLYRGSFQGAIDLPLGFNSRVPALFGLPLLPEGSNPAEGVVVRPMTELLGSGMRPLVKRKAAGFEEDRRFHGAVKQDDDEQPSGGDRGDTGPLSRMKWEVYCLATDQRLDAALSKVGPRPEGDRRSWARDLFSLLVDEVMEEAAAADAESWKCMTEEDMCELRACARDEVRNLLHARFGRRGSLPR